MRKLAKIQRVSDGDPEYARGTPSPTYLNDLVIAHEQGKTIVQVQRERQKSISSYLTNLQNILNSKPAYANVDEAVSDMRERTGLNTYLSRIAQRNKDGSLTDGSIRRILANINEQSLPEVLKKDKYKDSVEDIVTYIKDKIDSRNGNVSASAIQDEISKLYKLDIEDSLSTDIREHITSLIKEYKDKNGDREDKAPPEALARAGEDNVNDQNSEDNFFANMDAKKF